MGETGRGGIAGIIVDAFLSYVPCPQAGEGVPVGVYALYLNSMHKVEGLLGAGGTNGGVRM